jgi:hypothetical protein
MSSKRYNIDISLFQLKNLKQADDYNSRKSLISKPKAVLDGYSKTTTKKKSYYRETLKKEKRKSFSYKHQDLPRDRLQQP